MAMDWRRAIGTPVNSGRPEVTTAIAGGWSPGRNIATTVNTIHDNNGNTGGRIGIDGETGRSVAPYRKTGGVVLEGNGGSSPEGASDGDAECPLGFLGNVKAAQCADAG